MTKVQNPKQIQNLNYETLKTCGFGHSGSFLVSVSWLDIGV